MVGKLLNNFPQGYTPSDQQDKLIREIDEAFDADNKFVICSAPTGSGKSFISKTLANASTPFSDTFTELVNTYAAFKMDSNGNYVYENECKNALPAGAFALTITKTLQDQYQDLFEDTAVLKGKANYRSTIDENIDVEQESVVMPKKILDAHRQANKCDYHNDRNAALTSKFTALNYKMFLALPDHVKYKNYIICDEASELEDEIIKQFSVAIDIQRLRKLKVKIFPLASTKNTAVKKWLNEVQSTIVEHINILTDGIKLGLSNNELSKLKYLRSLHRTLVLISNTWQDCEYIVQVEDKFNIRLTPLKVDTLSSYIFKYAEKVLLMSATVIDHKNLAKTLGIKKYKYVESGSSFDPAKAPIYISKSNRLNHANLQKALPSIVEQIKEICKNHSGDKGIIHTHTNYITSYIQRGLNDSRFLYRDGMTRNEEILEEHTASDQPTVLVSPSLGLGVDLKGDLARFQIIIKAAYLPLGDDRIKRMFEQDKQWYANKMLSNFIQQCGRGVRNQNDHCITYVLDANIYDAVLRNKSKLPKYFLDRFI
jgi:ATP-dependent DNA helicase DinG